MIKAILIDDEAHALETLSWKLANYCPEIVLLAQFNDPLEGLDFLNTQEVDLVFLDIEMPRLNGFELLQKLLHPNFDVIFTTAYDEYGIKAIKFSALDYLLKPVQTDELIEAVKKYQKKHIENFLPQKLDVLFQSLNRENSGPQRIALATKESIELVKPSEIIMCNSDNNYTMVYLEGGKKKFISRTLKEFEEMLSPHGFFRTHQSFLVNLSHVQEYIRDDGGYLIMSNGMKADVSRSKRESLLNLF